MPYKDPERKRQWEQENRKWRNEQRRKQRLSGTIVAKRLPDPIPGQESHSVWPVLAQIVGFVLMVGIGLLAGWVEIKSQSTDCSED